MSSRAAQRKLKLKVKLGKAQHSPKVAKDDNDFGGTEDFSDDESRPKRARLSNGEAKKKAVASSSTAAFSSLFLPTLEIDDALVSLSIMQLLQLKDVEHVDTFQRAALLISQLIFPSDLEHFYQSTWEKIPLLSQRSTDSPTHFGKFLSLKQLKRILAANVFTLNEDLLANSSLAKTLNRQSALTCDGAALWKAFEANAASSFTIKSPQKLHQASWQLLSALEFQFNSQVDASWTCQMPGWVVDEAELAVTSDHDQFILQIEGSSTWEVVTKVDKDQNSNLQRFDIHAGDTLYLQKKAIRRQMHAHSESISLFVIISTNHQSNSIANFLQVIVPQALTNLEQESHLFGRGLPPRLRSFTSVSAATAEDGLEEDPRRDLFKKYVTSTLMSRLQDQVEEILDAGADQMSKSFILERLPIPLSVNEEAKTSAGLPDAIIYPYTILRMIRPEIAIAVVEDGKIVLYHCMDNSRVPGTHESSPLEFELDDGPAIELLLKAYPEGVMVQDLPHPSEELEDKVGIAQALFKEGFLLIVDETSRPADKGDSGTKNDQMDEENSDQLL